MKVYTKKGAKTDEERKMEKALSEFLEAKIKAEPNFEYTPARNIYELQTYYNNFCVEDAVIISEDTKQESEGFHTEQKNEEQNKDTDSEQKVAEEVEERVFVDPLNRANPTIRDYVRDSGFSDDKKIEEPVGRVEEPKTFAEAFKMPDTESEQTGTGSKNTNQKQTKPPPVNPHFDEMSNARKTKQTKKFAKYITEAVCMLVQKGFIWWTTKDINEMKIAEYELSGEIDLSLMLSLEGNQEITIKQFFQNQCVLSEQESHISQEDREDLTEALSDFLLEKGISPTPSQSLLMISLGIIGKKALTAIQISMQVNSVLNQLRDMKKNDSVEYEEQTINETSTAVQVVDVPKKERKKRTKKQ